MKNFLINIFRAMVSLTVGINICMLIVNSIPEDSWVAIVVSIICLAIVALLFEGTVKIASIILSLGLGAILTKMGCISITATIICNLIVITSFVLMALRYHQTHMEEDGDEDDEENDEEEE